MELERWRRFSPMQGRMETGCSMIPISELFPGKEEEEQNRETRQMNNLRVASPGIVQSFNAKEQTVTVKISIREKRVKPDGTEVWEDIPPLVDVPVVFPRGGGYVLTFPVQPGDECLVVFGDSCMDAWWQSGGIQNQIDCRRHDLSDGYAILGPWSQPRTIPDYSTSSVQLRTESGGACIEISGDTINIKAGTINIKGGKVYINE